jgi:hypothetical protein
LIDLSSSIRTAILNDTLATNIASFAGSKAIFTRRPAPTDATYPMVFISPQIPGAIMDYLDGELRREVIYDILTYGQNDDAAKYRTVEKIGMAIAKKFARPSLKVITPPTGYSIVKVVGTNMSVAPTDDLNIVGRMSTVTFTIQEN